MKAKRSIYLVTFRLKNEINCVPVCTFSKANASAVIREYYDFGGGAKILNCHKVSVDDAKRLMQENTYVWHCSQIVTPITPEIINSIM